MIALIWTTTKADAGSKDRNSADYDISDADFNYRYSEVSSLNAPIEFWASGA